MDHTESASATSSLVGATVIAVGVLAAMVFRTPAPPDEKLESPSRASTGGQFAIHDGDAVGPGVGVVLRDRNSLPPADISTSSKPDRKPPGRELTSSFADKRTMSAEPPSMPSQYGGLSDVASDPRQPNDGDAYRMTPRKKTPKMRSTHQVRSNDTLESIALRYYGDTTMAEAIFAANRHLLPSRTLLPFKTVLQLPDRESGRSLQRRADSELDTKPRGQVPRATGSGRANAVEQPRQGSPVVRTTLGSVR